MRQDIRFHLWFRSLYKEFMGVEESDYYEILKAKSIRDVGEGAIHFYCADKEFIGQKVTGNVFYRTNFIYLN